MTRNLLVCLSFMLALMATSGEVRAEPLCEPNVRPKLCIPGISTSPDCRVEGPVGAPATGGTLLWTAPELVLPVALPEPAPPARRDPVARFAIGATHPGYAREIDRPPKARS